MEGGVSLKQFVAGDEVLKRYGIRNLTLQGEKIPAGRAGGEDLVTFFIEFIYIHVSKGLQWHVNHTGNARRHIPP